MRQSKRGTTARAGSALVSSDRHRCLGQSDASSRFAGQRARAFALFFYHSLRNAMSRWFRVYDLEDARMRWDDWVEMRAEEEEYKKAEGEREGVPYEPTVLPDEPAFPACVHSTTPDLPQSAASLAHRKRAKQLIDDVESLAEI